MCCNCCNSHGPTCTPSFPPPFCILHPWRYQMLTHLSTVTGRGTPGVAVRVGFDGEQPTMETVVDATGWWSVELDCDLSAGPHTVEAYQYYGSLSESFAVPFVMEWPMLPTPTITYPADGTVVPTGPIAIRGTATPGSLVRVCLDGVCATTRVLLDGSFEMGFIDPPVTAGLHQVTVTEQNTETGQTSLPATSSFFAVVAN